MIIILDVIKRTRQNRNITNALQSIYGIGVTRSQELVREITGRVDLKLNSFKLRQVLTYSERISHKFYKTQTVLLSVKEKNVRRLKRLRCYRGLRLAAYLPSHGQRTKSNGITARYQGSGTFEYVPTSPVEGLKKICSFVRRTKGMKLRSEAQYRKLLSRNFQAYRVKHPEGYSAGLKRGQLGIFSKLAGLKRTKK